MRDQGADDRRIIRHIGLEEKAAFKMATPYLKELYGFVTSRASNETNGMYGGWLGYHNQIRGKCFKTGSKMKLA